MYFFPFQLPIFTKVKIMNFGLILPLLCSIYNEDPMSCPRVELPNIIDIIFILVILTFILKKMKFSTL